MDPAYPTAVAAARRITQNRAHANADAAVKRAAAVAAAPHVEAWLLQCYAQHVNERDGTNSELVIRTSCNRRAPFNNLTLDVNLKRGGATRTSMLARGYRVSIRSCEGGIDRLVTVGLNGSCCGDGTSCHYCTVL